jgi:hypothetical protein
VRHTRAIGLYEERCWRAFARSVSLAATAGGILSACLLPTDPFPRNAVPLAPPIQYGLWWQMVESCSALTGDLAAVRWYVQPGVQTLQVSGLGVSDAVGVWFSSGNRILLTESSVADGPTVRHEMLHALLGSGESDPHPKLYFRERCGGILWCDGPCAIDGGPDPLPPLGAAVIDARDLLVSAQIVPAVDSGGQTGGYIALVISAQNPRPDPVWVRLASVPGENGFASATYGYVGFGGDSYYYVYGDSIAFQGGETQRFALDISSVPSGTFPVRPFFNIDTLATMQYVVRP